MTEKPAIYTKAHFKVVELSTVTDETIQDALNMWTEKGWQFDQIQFVVRESSRRPSMAFLFFLQPAAEDEEVRFDVHKQDTHQEDDSLTADNENGDYDEINLS